MNILIINGSPKGAYSVTLQTALYLQKLHPEHTFEFLHAGKQIKKLEKDFSPALEAISRADLLLFSYPVYTFLAPSQLHRFIELLKASGMDLNRRFATQLTTSKHFYDVTAHRYIEDNCHDMGLRFIQGLSADMDDLLTEQGQHEADSFFRYVLWCMEQDICEPAPQPTPAAKHLPVTVPLQEVPKGEGSVVIVTNRAEDDTQLDAMIRRFRAKMSRPTKIVDLLRYPFKGGCLGCFNCAVTGACIYRDGFDDYLRNEIQTADAIVYAFSIRDHSMGASFKLYDDRQFCNGHRTVTAGTPIGYLISGDYSREFNLQTVLNARSQVGENFLAGVATDEFDPDNEIDRMAARMEYALTRRYAPPQNFYGVGGMKIFRDLIWLMQGMMRADHKFYKSHGHYDFPQKKWPRMLSMYLVGGLLSSKKLKAKMGNAMNEGMLMPYQKLLKK